jgi:hypothetical protein
MHHVLVVLGIEEDRSTRLGHGVQPVLGHDMRGAELQQQRRFAHGAFAREQRGLPARDAVEHRPVGLGDGDVIPVMHVHWAQPALLARLDHIAQRDHLALGTVEHLAQSIAPG